MKGQHSIILAFIGAAALSDAFILKTGLPPSASVSVSTLVRTSGWADSRVRASIMSDYPEENFPLSSVPGHNEIQPGKDSTESDSQVSKTAQSPVISQPLAKVKKVPMKHQSGIFSPLVLTLKKLLGDEKLNKLRGKGISLHSDVINRFTETSNTKFGQSMLATLFDLADRNGDGKLQVDELASALEALGFTWLQQKQVLGILERADKDKNGVIDRDEFIEEAPKTLRTNLVKLAKKNGGELGFLV